MNLYEKLNRIEDSLVESKTIVNKKMLTERYSNEMTEFMNWIQDYKDGALWNDFAAEFESEEDSDISVVLTWLENFDEDAYYDYVTADTYDDDIDEMLTETASFKSGDRYHGGLPSEPSMSEYGRAMDAARKNREAFLDKYNIKVDNDQAKGYTTYTGTINGHTFKYVEGRRDFSHWLSELVIDNKTVNPYKSSLNKISNMFETNAVSISDIVDLLLKDNFDNIVYKNSLTESEEKYELSTLVKDSINHLVNDLGKDPMADDFGDDVCADLEDNYDIDIPQNPVKYADWCDAVMSEVSRQLNNKEEQLTENRNNPYFRPYGYRDAAKILNRKAPEYYYHLKEIEMDRGDGVKLARYAMKKGLPVMVDKNSDPDYPEFAIKGENHWTDYFYPYPTAHEEDLVAWDGKMFVEEV